MFASTEEKIQQNQNLMLNTINEIDKAYNKLENFSDVKIDDNAFQMLIILHEGFKKIKEIAKMLYEAESYYEVKEIRSIFKKFKKDINKNKSNFKKSKVTIRYYNWLDSIMNSIEYHLDDIEKLFKKTYNKEVQKVEKWIEDGEEIDYNDTSLTPDEINIIIKRIKDKKEIEKTNEYLKRMQSIEKEEQYERKRAYIKAIELCEKPETIFAGIDTFWGSLLGLLVGLLPGMIIGGVYGYFNAKAEKNRVKKCKLKVDQMFGKLKK